MKLWLQQLLKPFHATLAMILAMQLFMAVIIAIQPLYMQQLVGVMLDGSLQNDFSRVTILALILAALFTGVAICHGINGFVSASFTSALLGKLQTGFFEKTAQLPLNYFQKSSSGEFFTRFNHDLGQTQNFIANTLPSFIREAITATALIGILLWFCPWQIVAAASLLTAVSVSLAIQCHRILDRYAIRQREGWNEINKQFGETIRGIDTIRTFGAEQRGREMFQQKTGKFRSLSESAGKITAVFSPVIHLVTRLGGLCMVVLAYYLIAGNQLGIDTFILFFFCSALFQGSITSMINLYTQMPQQLVGIRNLSAFFCTNGDMADSTSTTIKQTATINSSEVIEFSNLWFSYPDGEELFGGKNFNFPTHGITLVRGANGSGKSTLINLLLRFYQPSSGNIFIGGQHLSSFSNHELRNKISVVKQYHHVFDDTVRENLLVAKPRATDKELLYVLSMVGLARPSHKNSHILDQVLSSSENSMSGGERQRLNLARILLRDAPIIVFDEPWNNLDSESSQTLVEIIHQIRFDKTVIIISHSDQPNALNIDHTVTVTKSPEKQLPDNILFREVTNDSLDGIQGQCLSL